MYTGFATQLWSCGGRDFDPDGRCAFADAERVSATAAFIAALRDAGPSTGRSSAGTSSRSTSAGRYALLVDSDHYVAFFEDERTPSSSGASATRCPRQVRPASGARTSGRGRSR